MVSPANVTHVEAGSTNILSCVAYGDPLPNITWIRANSNLSSDPRITIMEEENEKNFVQSTLQIFKTQESDSDWYSCVATNAGGNTDTAGFELAVSTEAGIVTLERSECCVFLHNVSYII